ncbi:MAG: hypothetical protein IMZ66_07935 [Planctomycetes bacterium]|nr:hypothetical protein [Planctomycetota bacterium]
MSERDETRGTGNRLAWAIIIAFAAAIVVWGLLNYVLIPDAPRRWDFGQLPDTPGESVYSAAPPPPAGPPPQIPTLPEAQPKSDRGGAR